MKKLLLIFTLCLGFMALSAQGFSGIIEFKYSQAQKDTSMNVYTVKNKKVKLEQFGKKGNVEGSYLFDLEANEVKWINPKRKLWGFLKSETPQVIHGQCVTTKGSATKTIVGVKCTEYTVKNTEENTIITYWIAEGKYNFFSPMVKLWNHKGKQSIYFAQIKGLPEGSMPLLSEERQISDNVMVTKLEATKIATIVPAETTFTVPEGYTKFDQQ